LDVIGSMLTRRRVYILIIAFGGLQLALNSTTAAFVSDSYYYELARSFLSRSIYGFNSRAEPMVPPGFPALLALLILAVGSSYALLIRSIAFFTTIGLMGAYEVLDSMEGRAVAGVICLLLASSPALFQFSTRALLSDMPYFCTSMLALLALSRVDSAANLTSRLLWWTSCAVLLLMSILLRSTGIALVGGVAGWLIASQYRQHEAGRRRMMIFVPLIVLGLAVEGSWILWSEHHPVSIWPVHGFQESYVAQLRLKNGNNPELGMATWRDVLKRPIENEDDMATSMVGIFMHRQISAAWYSPATVIPLVLLLIGLAHSFSTSSGGEITEWYFVSYQFLYLFWPWNFELRFQLPMAALAALYMWRGGAVFFGWLRRTPRTIGIVCAVLAAMGVLSSLVWGSGIRPGRALVWAAVWSLVGCLSVLMAEDGQRLIQRLVTLSKDTLSWRGVRVTRATVVGLLVLMCLTTTGAWMQVVAGVDNLHRVPEMNPSIEAAEWIRDHSAPEAVVMGRWEALVYHYSGRRVVWFPASSDAQLLMAGIQRYHINFIVIAESEGESYWSPSDIYCFRVLLRSYPERFCQVHEGAHEQVYEVRE
jgi:hypothetical protein